MLDDVFQEFSCFEVPDFGSTGNLDDAVFAVASVLLFSVSGAGMFGALMRGKENADERGDVFVGAENNAATVAAIPTVRSTAGYKLLATKACGSITAVACIGVQDDSVNK